MLDVGCGTGIVTNLMSNQYPKAECFGLDLSPVPSIHTHSPHVHFMQGNVISQKPSQWIDTETQSSEGVAFNKDEGLFDYIFSRMQILGIYDWQKFVKGEFSLLKPGGWAEVHDIDWEYLDGEGKNISDNWVSERPIPIQLSTGEASKPHPAACTYVDPRNGPKLWKMHGREKAWICVVEARPKIG